MFQKNKFEVGKELSLVMDLPADTHWHTVAGCFSLKKGNFLGKKLVISIVTVSIIISEG